jgi:hypothetical protein
MLCNAIGLWLSELHLTNKVPTNGKGTSMVNPRESGGFGVWNILPTSGDEDDMRRLCRSDYGICEVRDELKEPMERRLIERGGSGVGCTRKRR